MNRFILNFVKVTGILPASIYFKRKVYYENEEARKKIKGKMMIVSNHRDIKDYMLYLFYFFHRNLHFLAAELLYRKKHLGKFIDYLGAIKVDRDSHEVNFVSKSIDILNQEKALLIFPEARISPTEEVLPFTTSFIYIALKSHTPICPVCTDGNYGMKKRCHIIVGAPLYLDEYCNNEFPSKEEIIYLTNIVRDKILQLQEQLHQKILQKERKQHEKGN